MAKMAALEYVRHVVPCVAVSSSSKMVARSFIPSSAVLANARSNLLLQLSIFLFSASLELLPDSIASFGFWLRSEHEAKVMGLRC